MINVRKKKNGKIKEVSNISFSDGKISDDILNAATCGKYLKDSEYYSVERDDMLYFDKFNDDSIDWSCKLSKGFCDKEVYQDIFLEISKISDNATKNSSTPHQFFCGCKFGSDKEAKEHNPFTCINEKECKVDNIKAKSRFMPNVKFKLFPCGIDSHEHWRIRRYIKTLPNCSSSLHYRYRTNAFGDTICNVFENQEVMDKYDGNALLEVSIYEAIPELVPEDMVYDKESDKLVKKEDEPKNGLELMLSLATDDMYRMMLDDNTEKYEKGELTLKRYIDKKIDLEFKKRGL